MYHASVCFLGRDLVSFSSKLWCTSACVAGSNAIMSHVSLSFPSGGLALFDAKLWPATGPSCARLPVRQAAIQDCHR